MQTTRELGAASHACATWCCAAKVAGTRIVSVVDCDYNNVVFAANEDLFDEMLGTLVAIARLLLLGAGNECLHLFVVRSCWVDDGAS